MFKEFKKYLANLRNNLFYLYKFGNLPSQNIKIEAPFYIENIEKINFKGLCYIGPHSYIAARGSLTIEDNVIIGPKVSIWTYSHNYLSEDSLPYGGTDLYKPIIIEKDVWIGYGVILLPGTKIGKGSVIGAGSVIRGEIPPLSLVMGNPHKIVRTLSSNRYNDLDSLNKRFLHNKLNQRV